jgi:hypothetical protein
MHLAYRLRRVKIAKMLDINEFYSIEELERNDRGQLPGEMTHSLDDMLQFERIARIDNFIIRHKIMKLNESADPYN